MTGPNTEFELRGINHLAKVSGAAAPRMVGAQRPVLGFQPGQPVLQVCKCSVLCQCGEFMAEMTPKQADWAPRAAGVRFRKFYCGVIFP